MANTNQQGNWKTYVFTIDFSCCDECPIKLKDLLLKLCGVDRVEVDAKENTVAVKSSLDSKKIIKEIKNLGKKAVLLHEKEENNPHGYFVELNEDDDEEKEKPSKPPACSHKSSSSSSCKNKSSSTHKPQSCNSSRKNTEVPEHICKDKYCTYHNREPYVDAGINYRPLFRGGHYPIGNFYPPPPPPPPMYVPRMVPPVAGHYSGGYSIHRPRNDVFTDVFSDEYSNGCSIM